MTHEVVAAGKRLRNYVDAWIAVYGDKGFLPRIGYDNIPSLAVADLRDVLNDWEGPHSWAVCEWRNYPDGGERMAVVLRTFLYEKDAERALGFFSPGSFVAWWDEGKGSGCWRAR